MNKFLTILSLALLALEGPSVLAAPRVLVVINERSPASVEIGSYYAKKRHIPAKQVCRLRCWPGEAMSFPDYGRLRADIRSHLAKNGLKNKIDYVVLTKGVPIKACEEKKTLSVDSMLTVLWSDDITGRIENPYFRSTRRFSYADQAFYLVTRLDGYTTADAKRLVDRSLAAKSQKGLFLFDLDPTWDGKPGYGWLNESQKAAVKLLTGKKLVCRAATNGFPGGEKGLIGYYTWGSNNRKFDAKKYAGNTFHPGAIAETVVSTSARTFQPTKDGQSLIGDLIQSGVTGVKGYVAEPYSISIAQPHILFDRYTSGFNLAESFYAASPFLHWMDIVVGDPLCAPWEK